MGSIEQNKHDDGIKITNKKHIDQIVVVDNGAMGSTEIPKTSDIAVR